MVCPLRVRLLLAAVARYRLDASVRELVGQEARRRVVKHLVLRPLFATLLVAVLPVDLVLMARLASPP